MHNMRVQVQQAKWFHLVEGRGVGAWVTKGAPVGEMSSVLTPTTDEPGNNL